MSYYSVVIYLESLRIDTCTLRDLGIGNGEIRGSQKEPTKQGMKATEKGFRQIIKYLAITQNDNNEV